MTLINSDYWPLVLFEQLTILMLVYSLASVIILAIVVNLKLNKDFISVLVYSWMTFKIKAPVFLTLITVMAHNLLNNLGL